MTRVGVGVVVRDPAGRVLVGRRVAEPGQPFAVPGGKLDADETIEECAIRELAEETGLEAVAVTVFAALLVDGWLVAGALAQASGTPVVREPDKFGALAWIDPREPLPNLYPSTAALLRAIE